MYIYLITILIIIIVFLLNFKRIESFFSFSVNKNITEICNPNSVDNGYVNYLVDILLKEINKCYSYNYKRNEVVDVIKNCDVYTINVTVEDLNTSESKNVKLICKVTDKSIKILSIYNFDILDLKLINRPILSIGNIENDSKLKPLIETNYYPFNKNEEIKSIGELSSEQEYNFNHPANFSSCLNIN